MTTGRRPLHNPAAPDVSNQKGDTVPTLRAQLTRKPSGWHLFVVVPGRVADWPVMDFLTIDGRPPTLEERRAALHRLGYDYAPEHDGWSWVETQDGAECHPQEGGAVVELSAVALVVEHQGADRPAGCVACGQPFDRTDLRWNGRDRSGDTDWCRGCVDRCHDSESADHRCPVCA